MRLILNGFESEVIIGEGAAAELSIESPKLLSRMVQSLLSEEGDAAVEPYALWNQEKNCELKTKGALFCITDPFRLPWDNRALVTGLLQRMGELLVENDSIEMEVDNLGFELRKSLSCVSLSLCSDYEFSIEWDVQKYLKTFGFKVEIDSNDRLIDNLIKFLSFYFDVGLKKPIVFVGLQNFLDEKELKVLVDQANFFGIGLLLLEKSRSVFQCGGLNRYTIDQHLLEH